MRVKFGKSIYSCSIVSHNPNSCLLIITTSNGVYTVDLLTSENAEKCFNDLLTIGYCDVSKYDYTN